MRTRSRSRFLVPILLAVVLAAAAYLYVVNHRVEGPLTGLGVSRDIAGRRAVAVMLDNFSPDARPQSGLDRASLVFETLAEGGITRFMAVYQEQDAPLVGPVRSTRLYFNAWATGLGVIFGHDGGNVDALQQLPSLSAVANVDADRSPAPFHRTTDRAVPHNEYTGTPELCSYAAGGGGAPPALPHKSDAPPSQRPASFALHVAFSSSDYNVDWRYDPAANDYLRFMGGAPHIEATTGKQLRAKNVIVMQTDLSADSDPFTPGAIRLRTEGTGVATVYRDGVAIAGTWSKPSVSAPLQWLDGSGNQIKLDRGNAWVEVVPTGTLVTTGR
ncbi:MAG: DUF3048 domain-containing protein [Chloroflexota bacterium]